MIDHYKKAIFFVNLGGHEILSDKVSPQLKQKHRSRKMEHEKQLFSLENENIKISISLGFEGEHLKLDGYDVGKTVSDNFGDSDYEYSITVSSENLQKLYEINDVSLDNKIELINALSIFLSVNEAYSLFHDYLKKNEIEFTSYTYN